MYDSLMPQVQQELSKLSPRNVALQHTLGKGRTKDLR